MDLAIKIDGVCGGGGHIFLTVTEKGQNRKLVLNRRDLHIEPDGSQRALVASIRSFIKEQGFTQATPLNQLKTAIEAKVFKL